MEIVKGSVKYYPGLSYKRFNARLLFGWTLFYHKDAWSWDIHLYKEGRQIDLVYWRRYNTLCGMRHIIKVLFSRYITY